MPARIVIVEDDRSVRESLTMVLEFHGHEVQQCPSGIGAVEVIESSEADLVILDISLPGLSGLDICRALRSRGDQRPVLMVTARHDVADRVLGLDAGADDYLPKPFSLDELLARVRALLRRATAIDHATAGSLALDDVVVDMAARTVQRGVRPIDLTKIEFDLLALLIRNQNIVLTRAAIYEDIWGYDDTLASNSLEVFVSALRRKLEADAGSRLIHTIRGVGYVARPDHRTQADHNSAPG